MHFWREASCRAARTAACFPLFLLGLAMGPLPSAQAAAHFVNSSNNILQSKAPYTNWATAARQIQDAVNASAAGDVLTGAVGRGTGSFLGCFDPVLTGT